MEHSPLDDAIDAEPAELLVHYLARECTPGETSRVEAWVLESTAHREILDAAQLAWDRSGSTTDLDPEKFVARLRSAMVQMPDQSSVSDNRPLRTATKKERGFSPQRSRWWIGSLGGIAMFVAAFLAFWSQPEYTSGVTRSYTTGIHQQGIVTLDDSTRVILAPQTTLTLLNFSKQSRTVAVEGRAYFEVTRTGGAPFEVRSGSATARVLGTTFLIEHAPRSARVRVAVGEGKVHVSVATRAATGFTVAAGYVGDITDSSMIVNAVIDSSAGTEWQHGKLVFHHKPVAVVLQTLSRWYGYQFRYADSTLPHRSVTIGVSVSSSASALATLEQVLRVNLTMIGDTVTLTPSLHGRGSGLPKVRSYDVWTPVREVGR